MQSKKKKAFTLTELLVVVIVIGVLSAVVLPKFSKVVETRKTTEAEELMAAVRMEQEKRCSLDQNYLADAAGVRSILPEEETKNFNYSLTSTGIAAASKGKYGYTLKMPSYKDGRICCENAEECAKLNKDYPLCSELMAKADYQSGEECQAPVADMEKKCGTRPMKRLQRVCNGCGLQRGSYQCNTTTGTWETVWGECSKTAAECTVKECSAETKPNSVQSCGKRCGSQSRTVSCNTSTGEWDAGDWGACEDAPTAVCDAGSLDFSSGTTCSKGFGSVLSDLGLSSTAISQLKTVRASDMVLSNQVIQATTLSDVVSIVDQTKLDTDIAVKNIISLNKSGRVCNNVCQWETLPCLTIAPSEDDDEDNDEDDGGKPDPKPSTGGIPSGCGASSYIGVTPGGTGLGGKEKPVELKMAPDCSSLTFTFGGERYFYDTGIQHQVYK